MLTFDIPIPIRSIDMRLGIPPVSFPGCPPDNNNVIRRTDGWKAVYPYIRDRWIRCPHHRKNRKALRKNAQGLSVRYFYPEPTDTARGKSVSVGAVRHGLSRGG
ncbi:hypothetical protein GCM10020229_43100 [Kitasatospora albolonga]